MLFAPRLWLLLLLFVGCAEQALVVPDADWTTVPPAQRAQLDRQCDADLAAARTERAAAATSLAALPRAQSAAPRLAPRAPVAPAAPQDPWAEVAHDHERARIAALRRVDVAQAELQRTDQLSRQLRLEAASARIEVLVSQRELIRAQAIDRHLPGDDHYDVAPLRGQFSRAQQRWYAVMTRARAAHDAVERASAELASAKEAYAQLMRNGLPRLPAPDALASTPDARLELHGWTIARSDIRRRRGLRHLLDEVGAKPLLRSATLQLSPIVRAAAPPSVAARPVAPPPAGAAPAPASGDASRPTAPAAPAAPEHPADRAAAATSAGSPAAPAAQPGAPRQPAAAPRPAAAPASAPAPAAAPGPAGAVGSTAAPRAAKAVELSGTANGAHAR